MRPAPRKAFSPVVHFSPGTTSILLTPNSQHARDAAPARAVVQGLVVTHQGGGVTALPSLHHASSEGSAWTSAATKSICFVNQKAIQRGGIQALLVPWRSQQHQRLFWKLEQLHIFRQLPRFCRG